MIDGKSRVRERRPKNTARGYEHSSNKAMRQTPYDRKRHISQFVVKADEHCEGHVGVKDEKANRNGRFIHLCANDGLSSKNRSSVVNRRV